MDYEKRYFEKKKIEKVPAGGLIAYGAHHSLVLVTDKITVSLTKKTRHCVSLNGYSEDIPFNTEVLSLKRPILKVIKANHLSVRDMDTQNSFLEQAYKTAYPKNFGQTKR